MMLKELKNIIRLVLPALLLSFVSGAAEWSVVSAQVQVEQRIDSIEMLIGEQTLLHLQVTMKNGQCATLPHFKPGQHITPGVEVLGQHDHDTLNLGNGMVQIGRDYTLTSFDEKLYPIPALNVKVNGRSYRGNQLALKVQTVEVDTLHPNKFFPPKDVQDNPFRWSEWSLLFWLGVLLVVLSAFAAYVFYRWRQNKPIVATIRVVKRVPVHQKALAQIEEIKHEHTENREAQKVYYTKLTDAIREYISSRFGFSAMEMTSGEIIERLQATGNREMIEELRELFQTADLVKFAKYETLINENDANLVNAIHFIDQTKTDELPTEERIAPILTEKDRRSRQNRLLAGIMLGVVIVAAVALFVYMSLALSDLLM